MTIPEISDPLVLSPDATAIFELFQYMIGNLAYSIVRPYNIVLLYKGDEYLPIPTWFSFAGIMDPTAEIGAGLLAGERLYRGFCREASYSRVLGLFRTAKQDIYDRYLNEPRLDLGGQATALMFLDDFFDQISDSASAMQFVKESCRPVS